MKKIKSFFNENKYILISGGASLFIILLVYFCYEIIPFGDKTVYRMDLYHQYGPLFSELYDRITSGGSLIYSWTTGLGSSFLGNFYNYLSSPISFIILLFGHKNTFEAVAAMIAVKAVLSAMSMSYYLKKSKGEDSLMISAFGILYAFCGYFIAYYWNVMWIDALYLLPFVILGIERIFDSGKVGTYIIALAVTIFSNYYIGFMVCIFSCLYFVYYFICLYDNAKKRIQYITDKTFKNRAKNSLFFNSALRFALASLSVGLILMFMLIPLVFILRSSSATGGGAPDEAKLYFKILDFLANHLASLEPTIRSSGESVLPNIYCGILPLLLIPLYMFSKNISSKEKIATVVFLSIMFFSFNLNILNFAWHGFHFPNDLPYRQSFMYSFLLLIISFKAVKNIKDFNKNQILAAGLVLSAFIIAVQAIGSKNVTDNTIYISLIFTFIFTVILGLMTSKKNQMVALSVMLVCTVTAEMITANTDHYVANQSKSSFADDYDDFKDIQSKVSDTDDSLFYREELTHLRARMDASWFSYNGVSVFSSMAYEKTSNMQKYIGLYGNLINSYTYNPQTPIYNSMFSLKYIYDKSNYISECDYYSLKDSNSTFKAYENNYPLSIAFPVSDALNEWDSEIYENPVTAQNELFRLATGVQDVIEYIYDYEVMYNNVLAPSHDCAETGMYVLNRISDDIPASMIVTITAKADENIYIYVNSRDLDTVNAYSFKLSQTMSVSDGYILDLGKHSAGDSITVELPLKDSESYANVDFSVFTIDNEKFKSGYQKMHDGQLEYTSFSDTKIEGNFVADSNEILFTSIPYDASWQVYIDGERVNDEDIVKISDALLGVRVSSGEHSLKLVYKPIGITMGTIISTFFILWLIILYFLKKNRLLMFKNRKENIWERTSNLLNKEVYVPIIFDDEVPESNIEEIINNIDLNSDNNDTV